MRDSLEHACDVREWDGNTDLAREILATREENTAGTQKQKMALLRELIVSHSRICTAACRFVLGASGNTVVSAQRIVAGEDDGEQGL